MENDRHSVSYDETFGIEVDAIEQKKVSSPHTEGSLALDTNFSQAADHPTCGTPPECLPVTPANGCISDVLDYNWLQNQRKLLNISYQHIASSIGVSKATISRFFCGQSPNPSMYNVVLIFRCMGISLDEAFGIPHKTVTVEVPVKDPAAEVEIARLNDTISILRGTIADKDSRQQHDDALTERAKEHLKKQINSAERERDNALQELHDEKQLSRRYARIIIVTYAVIALLLLIDALFGNIGNIHYEGGLQNFFV